MSTVKSKIVSSMIWKTLERGSAQAIQLVVQIILARLLNPEAYGTIALVAVFINLSYVFVQSGLGTALIQKKNADSLDFSSVFYISIFMSIFLYFLLFMFAPFIADFYRKSELVTVLRVLGLSLIFGAINGVYNSYISKNMLFKELFWRNTVALLISGITGIVAAYQGLGVWALVIQQIAHGLSTTIIMWYTINWRPAKKFSLTRVRSLFSFGYKLLLSALIDTLYREIRTLIIGKMHNASTLGYYSKGEQIPKLIMTNVDGSIQAVMLPALSAHQDERSRVKAMMRRSITTSSFIIFPIMIGLAAIAEPLVVLLLTDKWLPSVPFLQIFCFSYMLWPIHTANLQAINALGRSDIFLKLELIKKIIGIAVLLISVPMGAMAIAIGTVVSGVIGSAINARPNKQLLDYGYFEQIRDLIPALIASLVMGIAVFAIALVPIPLIYRLLLQIAVGFLIYIALSTVFKIEVFNYLYDTFGDMLKKLLRRKR